MNSLLRTGGMYDLLLRKGAEKTANSHNTGAEPRSSWKRSHWQDLVQARARIHGDLVPLIAEIGQGCLDLGF